MPAGLIAFLGTEIVIGALGLGITYGGLLAGALLTTALSFGLTALTARGGLGPNSTRVDTLRQVQRSNSAPARVGYGETVTSGVLAFAMSVDEDGVQETGGKYLHICLLLGLGPIAGIDSIRLNDVDLNDPEERQRFGDLVAFIPFFGFGDQEAIAKTISVGSTVVTIPIDSDDDDDITTAVWTEDHRLQGIAYVWAVLVNDPKVFPSGAPNITARLRQRLVYDPRDAAQSFDDPDTWSYSTNWALCCFDFATNKLYGLGIALADVDLDAIVAEADYADELVDTPVQILEGVAGHTPGEEPSNPAVIGYEQQKRYIVGGIWETDSSRLTVMQMLLQAGGGSWQINGGLWRLRSARVFETNVLSPLYDGAYGTLTDDDLRAPLKVLPKPGRKARVNTVRGTFPNPLKNFEADDFPPVTIDAWKKEDGNLELASNVDFPFVPDAYQCQRLARFELKRQRGISCEAECKPSMIKHKVGDVLQLTITTLGWSAKKFEIVDAQLVSGGSGGMNFTLQEYADENLDESPDGLNILDESPDTTLADPFAIGPVEDLAGSAAMVVNHDGTRVARISLTWSTPLVGNAQEYEVSWWRSEDGAEAANTQRAKTSATSYEISSVREGLYQLGVIAISQTGVRSAARSIALRVDVRVLPPPDVAYLLFELRPNGTRVFEWALSEEEPDDFLGYDLRFLTGAHGDDPVAEWETASILRRRLRSTQFETLFPTIPGEYTFYVRSLDRSHTFSNGVAFVVVTIPAIRGQRVLHVEEASEDSWEGGTYNDRARSIAGGIVNAQNELQALGKLTWDELTDWASFTAWSQKPRVFSYTHAIDLGEALDFFPTMDVELSSGTAVLLVRGRGDELEDGMPSQFGPFGGFALMQSIRYIEFRVIVHPAVDAADDEIPTLSRFTMTLFENLITEYANDLDAAALADTVTNGSTSLREIYSSDFARGTQYNTRIAEDPLTKMGSLEIDSDVALQLNGSTQHATIPDLSELRLIDSFTIECTIKPDVLALNAYVFSKGTDWIIRYGVAGTGIIDFSATGYTGDNPNDSSARITVDDVFAPITIAFRFDKQALRWSGFLNGVRVFHLERTFELAQSSDILRIGSNGGASQFFDGIVEEFRVFDYARSDEDIAADVRACFDDSTPGLVGYWRCDDRTGSTLIDVSRLKNHATLIGSPSFVKYAVRESPAYDLSFIPFLRRNRLRVTSTTPAGTSITIEGRLRDDVAETWVNSWTAISGGELSFLTMGDDFLGKSLYLRQLLSSTDLDATPAISRLELLIVVKHLTGDIVYVPRKSFATLESAVVTAVQASAPIVASVVAKSISATRVRLFNPQTGALTSAAKIDLQLLGSAAKV